MSRTKLSLGGNNDVIYKLFPPRESLVSDIPAGDGNIEKLFLQCRDIAKKIVCRAALRQFQVRSPAYHFLGISKIMAVIYTRRDILELSSAKVNRNEC